MQHCAAACPLSWLLWTWRTCGTCTPLSAMLFEYSLTLNKMFGFYCPGRGQYERFTFIFQWTTFSLKKKQLYSPLWSAGAFQNIYFMLNRVTHRFLHFIISTRSHLIFIFLEKILASSRRELKTQHWLIYQDNSSSAVSQCHNDLYAQDFCCIVDSDL